MHDHYHVPIDTSKDNILGLDELLEGILAQNVEDVNPHFAPSTLVIITSLCWCKLPIGCNYSFNLIGFSARLGLFRTTLLEV